MKLKEIRLKNFRCYEDLTVPLDKKLTVLVAPNGQGKTTILDAISIALWDFIKKFDLSKPRNNYNIGIKKDDIRIVRDQRKFHHNEVDEIIESRRRGGMIRQLNTEIIATDSENFSWKRYRDSEETGKQTKEDKNARVMQKRAAQLQLDIRNLDHDFINLPIFAYYGTGRLWDEKRLTEKSKKQHKIDNSIRTFAYQNSLEPASNYKQFEDWFIEKSKQLTDESRELWESGIDDSLLAKELKNAISNIQESIKILLKIVGWSEPKYSDIFDGIVLSNKEHGTLKLDQLSDGIQNIFGMVADIAYRCYLLNSHLGENAFKQTEGIVLIDEVDMHLHPEWQQVILRDLQEAFPNLQFIVTTHSPQVLSSIKQKHIRILRDEQIIQPNDLMQTYGELSSNVLHEIMGVNPRPPIVERSDIDELTNLVDGGLYDTPRAYELLVSLKETLGESHESIKRVERSIQRQKYFSALANNQEDNQ